jgi:hypothetical protein
MIPRVNIDLINSQYLDDPRATQNECNRKNNEWNQSCDDNLNQVIKKNEVVVEHACFSTEFDKYLKDIQEHSVNEYCHPRLVCEESNLCN